MVHAEPGEQAAQVGVMIFRYAQPDINLWVRAKDFEDAKAAVREYALADENRRQVVFPDNLTAAVFVRLTADGRLIGVGKPLDLQALGIVPAA